MMNKSNKSLIKPAVGIFMPCYNLGDYIEEAIDSLERQTYKDFEVIIADDASTDTTTIDKLKSLQLPKNYTLFFEAENLGMNKITNKYTKEIDAEFLLIFSADDVLSPSYVERTVNFLKRNHNYGAVSTWLKYFDEGTGIRKYLQEETSLKNMLMQNNFCGSAMMRKSLWEDVGGYDTSEEFRKHQDYDLWLSVLEKGYKLGVIEEPLFNYRVLSSSLSRDVNHKDEEKWLLNLINKHTDSYQKYFPEIISSYYGKLVKSIDDYRQVNKGREWLEEQNHSTSKLLEEKEIALSELEDKYIKVYRYSLFRIKAVIKRLINKT